MKKKCFFSLLLGLSLNPFLGFSQSSQTSKDSTTSNSNILNEVTIQGSRLQIPFNQQNRDIVVLDTKVIQSLPVHSINELLSYVAGIDVRQRGPWGGQADISINGGTFDETLVLLNGMKIIDPQTGHNMMNLPINPESIKRIEILKGAAASAYGINAMNGAINIITKQPNKTGLTVNLTSGSSFNRDTSSNKLYANLGMGVTASLAGERSRHFIAFSTLQSSGYRYNTAMNNDKLFYQNHLDVGKKSSLNFMGGFVYNEMGTNGFYAPPGDVESKETIQTTFAAIKGTFQINKAWTIRPSISYRYNFDDYIYIRQKPSVYENRHYTNVVDASINNTFNTVMGNFGLGIAFRNASINSNSLGEWSRKNYGLFAEYEVDMLQNLNIHLGAFLNHSKDFDWQFLPSVDIGYQLNPNWRIFANAGTGTRLPTYTDWYYKGPANIGNRNLKPENAVHAELGVKYNQNNLHASASYFYRYTSNFIDWVKDSLTAPWQPHNFQEIKTPGISLSADYRLLQPLTEKGLTLLAGLSYTWLNPTISTPADQKKYIYSHYSLENLKNHGVLRLHAGLLKYFGFSVTGRYQQRMNYKDYFLMDTRIEGHFNHFKANISLNNLTNVTYIETGAIPLPGRWLSIGLQWQI